MIYVIICVIALVLFYLWMWWEIKHTPSVSEDYPDDKMDELIARLKPEARGEKLRKITTNNLQQTTNHNLPTGRQAAK